MNNVFDGIIFLIGVCLGGFGVYLLIRSKGNAAFAALTERISNREMQLQEFQTAIDKSKEEISGLREEVKTQSDRRSAAEEKNTRLPELEAAISIKEKRIADLQTMRT
jgi:septal ring factor EnvC (AmiA/AmiB activator)